LRVKVEGPCRRMGWGERVFFVIIVRGHSKRTKRGKSRAPMAFWVHAVSDGTDGWQLPVPLKQLLLKVWQRWEVEVGFRWMKSGFGLGEKPCWGFDSGERSVACVGVRGVDTNRGDHSLQKQARLKPPSLRFPLRAGGTEPVRGSPRKAGGTCRRGAIVNSARAIGNRWRVMGSRGVWG
jgi:hypothetical protein